MAAAAPGASVGKPKLYNPRHPERTLPYQTIAAHFETWFELASAGQGDHHTPKPYVRQAFRKYLECGIFARGFARAWCDDCGHDYFVAYSCKGRGVCPSCNTRRMVETAAHLCDHVFPRLPVRQWVLSVPKRLRYFMQVDLSARELGLLEVLLQRSGRMVSKDQLSVITEGTQIRRILDHIGVDSEPPHISPARGPPLWDDCGDAHVGESVAAEPDWDLPTVHFHGEPAPRAGNPGFARGSKPVNTAARAIEWPIRSLYIDRKPSPPIVKDNRVREVARQAVTPFAGQS